MKGNTRYNKPQTRKKEIYQLIVQEGGEARWKTLKTHLQTLRLGPTTLKQTIDEMIKEQLITKEARLGPDGAEVWYKTNNIKVNEIWKNFCTNIDPETENPEGLRKTDALVKMYEDIAINASKLTGTEKERYLQAQMQQIVRVASEAFIAFLTLYVREAQFRDRAKLNKVFDYFWSDLLLRDTRIFLTIFAESPTISLREMHRFLSKDKAELESLLQAEEELRKKLTDSL